ncbi:3-deoxy-7-phosphoheptulonate synthase [Waddlia chondrophila]|uniref:Phospho-2-dehydro-3-deoxyheptonate aldolase n=1 Tax=Waddlia chondrophila (strain ATCC VR-1470 / WSU 86-1044) TaxID=716544 RepID=D6YRI2_WADCW|nr:3-deoxy-7-phosphoheptulonate synthase [Waddlia chondrophila]ADI38677.1 phospho-2-dehydro-3-deoxyheptonate aldolase [Waddlia chondrophila WSU 86-1044]
MLKISPFNTDCSDSLLTPLELKEKLPATVAQTEFVEQSRSRTRRILNGQESRLLAIVGPCSIHDPRSAIDYAQKLKKLSSEVEETLLIVMRVYFEKPRTVLGWKGFMYDPHLNGSYDVATGVQWTRELFLQLTDMGIPLAAELLDPLSFHYFGDLITWSCIGARTSSSQIHRQIASHLPMPVAFKNNTDGNIEIAVNGAVSSSEPHTFLSLDPNGKLACVKSLGNPDSHIVLRGGEQRSNYDASSIAEAIAHLESAQMPQKIIIDCSHDNSRRSPYRQREVLSSVMDQIVAGNDAIKGFILESHIEGGNQSIHECASNLKYGVSITDPCLDWKTTKSLIKDVDNALKTKNFRGEGCRQLLPERII